ncbi:MAG: YabP/YqfC family sporulation protein [Clostridia bacterium]|nr:YabP/YqfC family sporulation protein [Clostridia bacterium]
MAKVKSKNKITKTATQIINPPTVDLISNKEALINGCCGILEYDTASAKINCGNMIIGFYGNQLSVQALSIEEIVVTGEIIKIEFSNC